VSDSEARKPADAVPSIIVAKLRTLIACGHFAPGMRLGQTELAEQFSASRVPVREALKLLSAEGLVEHDPNRGFFIARFSTDEALQYFRLRDMVEDELLPTIRWPEPDELEELRVRAARLEDLLNEGNRNQWWSEHQAFHHLIFDLSPAKVFVREAMRYWSLTDRYRALVPLPRRDSAERRIVAKADLVDALAQRRMGDLLEVRAKRRKAFEDAVVEVLRDRGL
jgi:DNA-binding GntR family transcriptional regulator